jgi:hypothetical protein
MLQRLGGWIDLQLIEQLVSSAHVLHLVTVLLRFLSFLNFYLACECFKVIYVFWALRILQVKQASIKLVLVVFLEESDKELVCPK